MKHFILFTIAICHLLCGHAQTYFLNGNAQNIGDDCYQLTGSSTNQNGTVWYEDQINLTEPFDLQFTMNFGTLDTNGADGVCFVLQTVGTAAIGQSGGGMGYLNFGTSLGIEFDTWQNNEYGDPSHDHIAIEKNGDINHSGIGNIAGPVQADPLDINIEDGEDHVTRIVWNPTDHIIQVYFDCVFRLSGEIDLINEIFNGQELVYWGFTAATGGSFNNQTVCLQENILNIGQDISLCTGGSVELQAGSSIDGVYNWTPTTFLENPSSPNPLASPPSNATYQVSFIDLCNQPVELSFAIVVAPLVVNVSPPQLINCNQSSTTISASINVNADANYTWTQSGNTLATGENISSFTTSTPGTYQLAVSAMDGCIAQNEFTVIQDLSVVNVSAGPDLFINCVNSSVLISASINPPSNLISWQFNNVIITGQVGNQHTATNPGTYTLSVAHPVSGCVASDDVEIVSDFTTPTITIGEQDSLTCIFPILPIQNVDIGASQNYTIQWTTNEGNITGGFTTLTPTVSVEGNYLITAVDNQSGCSATDLVFIGESNDFHVDLSSLVFPNILTPNGDAKNDRWSPFLRDNVHADLSNVFSVYNLKIFNRWGALVFESKNFSSGWNGGELADGVFYYLLQYTSNCDGTQSGKVDGHVHLMR